MHKDGLGSISIYMRKNIICIYAGIGKSEAFIERFNGILRKECLGHAHYKRHELDHVQKAVDKFLDYYHNKRPHLSLGMKTPHEFNPQCRI